MANIDVPQSVRQAFEAQRSVAELLQTEVRQLLSRRPPDWHVTFRVKTFDSFVEKLQTGRVQDQARMEDFFAATVVVPSRASLEVAEKWLEGFIVIDRRRPDAGPARVPASDFRFDDLRLYGRLLSPADLPSGPIHDMPFEVQVKTFLQHAWGVATHDTVYKTDKASWTRNRMAFQIRALLEHAESAASAIDAYESTTVNPVIGEEEARVQSVVDLINSRWKPDFLPLSLVRAGSNIDQMCKNLGIDTIQFVVEMNEELDKAEPPLGWSPYQFAVQVAARRYPDKLTKALKRPSPKAHVYYVTPDILEDLGLNQEDVPAARI